MARKFLLTAFCKDRPGIIADISQIIYDNGCNLEDSAMTNLAGEFAIILLFSSLPTTDISDLEKILSMECRRLEKEKGITAFIRPFTFETDRPQTDSYTKNVYVEGLDQAGIVFKVSRYLADSGINIRTLNSKVKNSPESGAAIYSMTLAIDIPLKISFESVEQGLNQIGDELNVDVTIS